jgi:hypothetical protein
MGITQISKIQVRTGTIDNLPALSPGEFGYATDTKQLFIGNGGTSSSGNTEILTEATPANFNLPTGNNSQILYNSGGQAWSNAAFTFDDSANSSGIMSLVGSVKIKSCNDIVNPSCNGVGILILPKDPIPADPTKTYGSFGTYTQHDTVLTANGVEILRATTGGDVKVNGGGVYSSGIMAPGYNVSTGDAGIEIGKDRTGNGLSFVDFHSTSGTDYEARISRNSSVNGAFDIKNTGNGGITLGNIGSGDIKLYSSNIDRVKISASGEINLGADASSKQQTTRISGYGIIYNLASGARAGSYGKLILNADRDLSTSARRYMITNGYNKTAFAILRSTDTEIDPDLGVDGVAANSTADLVIDQAGRIGMGVDPSNWNSSYKAFDIGTHSSMGQKIIGSNEAFMSWNAYGSSNTSGLGLGYAYKRTNDVASLYTQNGNHSWFTTTTVGTADASISFGLPKMQLDSQGRLGLGTIVYSGKFNVSSNTGLVGLNAGTSALPEIGNLYYIPSSSTDVFNIGKFESSVFTAQLTVRSDGNIGVGTITPSTKLQVVGNITASGFNTGKFAIIDESDGVLQRTTGYLRFANGATETVKITSVGDVGIGASTPLAKLHTRTVSDTEKEIARFENTNVAGTDTHYLKISADNVNNVVKYDSTGINAGAHIFSSSGNDRVSITADGKVGIGTNTPAQRLDIDLSAGGSVMSLSTTTQATSISNPGQGLRFGWNGSNKGPTVRLLNSTGTYNNAGLVFSTWFDNSEFQAVRIDHYGNMGLSVVPGQWVEDATAIQLGLVSSISDSPRGTQIAYNVRESSTNVYTYLTEDQASLFKIESDGSFKWMQAASGVEGTLATFNQAAVLTSTGNFAIGLVSPNNNAKLQVNGNGQFSGTVAVGFAAGPEEVKLDLGLNRTASGPATINLYSDSGTTVDSQFIREAGPNGNFAIINSGTGDLKLVTKSAGDIRIATNDAERILIDQSGRISIGTTFPNDWESMGFIDFSGYGSIGGSNTMLSGNSIYMNSNWYYNEGNKYRLDNGASSYELAGGIHKWYSIVSGTAGSSFEFGSPKMTMIETGQLGIGTTPNQPSGLLQVNSFITAGDDSATEGSVLLRGNYSNLGQSTAILGTEFSSGAPVISYGVKPSKDSKNSFVSTIDSSIPRSAITVENGIKFFTGVEQGTNLNDVAVLTQSMSLSSNGNLGLGTTTPVTKLDVVGSISGTGNLTLTSGEIRFNTSGDSVITNVNTLDGFDTGRIIIRSANATSNSRGAHIILSGNEAEDPGKLTLVAGSKNVGIEINGSGGPVVLTSAGGTKILASGIEPALTITNTGLSHSLLVEDSENPDNTPFVIDKNGSIGVGILLPEAKVHVKSNEIRIDNTESTTSANLRLMTDKTHMTVGVSGSTNAFVITDRSTGFVAAQYNGGEDGYWAFNSSGSERLRLDSEGDLIPRIDIFQDFGAETNRWRRVYTTNIDAGTDIGVGTITGRWTFNTTPILKGLAPRQAMFTDAFSQIVSNTITGTGDVVMSDNPTLTGLMSGESLRLSSLTENRIVYAEQNGLLADSPELTFNNAKLSVPGVITSVIDIGTSVSGLVKGVWSFDSKTIMSVLTPSQAVFTDPIRGLISNPITGQGNVVMSDNPVLTGTISADEIKLSVLTQGRVPYVGMEGLLQDSDTFTFGESVLRAPGVDTEFLNYSGITTGAITGTWTFLNKPIMGTLNPSQAVFTDSDRGLISNEITGTGKVVMSDSPVFTGLIDAQEIQLSSLTKDRIPFSGINGKLQDSENLTYSDSVLTVNGLSTDSINLNNAVKGNVDGVWQFNAQPIISTLLGDKAVFTDSNSGLISKESTGTGKVVLNNSPVFEGTITVENLVVSSMVEGHVPYVSVDGLLKDTPEFAFDGYTLLAPRMQTTELASVGTAGNITGTWTFDEIPRILALTGNKAVFTDSSSKLISKDITGTGNVVLSDSPTFSGIVSADNLKLAALTEERVLFVGTNGILQESDQFTYADSTLGVPNIETIELIAEEITTTGIKANAGPTGYMYGTWTFNSKPIISTLTGNLAVFTDTGGGLVSREITGTGKVVMSDNPVLNGTLTTDNLRFNNLTQGRVLFGGPNGLVTTAAELTYNTGVFNAPNIVTKTLSTGAENISGTITGDWTLTSGSTLQATYADLAEYYTADSKYEPGTVLAFGGEQELTLPDEENYTRIAGVVSTNPAYIMNTQIKDTGVAIALVGRVPVKVHGKIRKGDLLCASKSHFGAATVGSGGGSIGRALQNYDSDSLGVIEVMTGRN